MSRYRDWKLDCKVYVGDLGHGAAKHELEDAFGKYGALRNVWVARNPPGFAFVEFEDPRDAEDACRALDGVRLNGRRVRVEMSSGKARRGGRRPQPPRPNYGGGGGGGGDRGRRRRSRSFSPKRRSRSYSRSRSRSLSHERRRSGSIERRKKSRSKSNERKRQKNSRDQSHNKSRKRSRDRSQDKSKSYHESEDNSSGNSKKILKDTEESTNSEVRDTDRGVRDEKKSPKTKEKGSQSHSDSGITYHDNKINENIAERVNGESESSNGSQSNHSRNSPSKEVVQDITTPEKVKEVHSESSIPEENSRTKEEVVEHSRQNSKDNGSSEHTNDEQQNNSTEKSRSSPKKDMENPDQ